MSRRTSRTGPKDGPPRKADMIPAKKKTAVPKGLEAPTGERQRRTAHDLQSQRLELEKQKAELRQVREELDRLRTRYASLYDRAPVCCLTVSEGGTIIEANTAAAHLLGTAKGDLVTKPLGAFIVPEDRETYLRFSRSPLPMGAPRQCELRMAKKGGVIIWGHLTATALHDTDGSPLSQILIQDITSHKQAQEALIRSEENFRRSVEDSPLGVRIVSPKGELIYANRAILDIYGCESFDELKGTPVSKLYTSRSYAEHRKRRLERQRGKRGPAEYEVNIISRKGDIRHLDVVRRPILWNGEEQFQVIYRDITDRIRMEENLRRKEEELGIESQQLAEANMALRALLRNRDEDRKAMEKQIIDNIHQLIIPYVKELRKLNLNSSQLSYLDIIDANLQQIANPFLQNISSRFTTFTPREIQIANLIREGKTNKEIADFIKTAPRSVEFHRNNIRRKAGLKGKKINLRSFLLSLSQVIFK